MEQILGYRLTPEINKIIRKLKSENVENIFNNFHFQKKTLQRKTSVSDGEQILDDLPHRDARLEGEVGKFRRVEIVFGHVRIVRD